MTGRLTLGALACVFLLGIALSLAVYILLGLPVVHALASTDSPAEQQLVSAEIPYPHQAVGPTEPSFLERTLPSPTQRDWLPPCLTEDSDNCYWDAQTMGNGLGHDSVVISR